MFDSPHTDGLLEVAWVILLTVRQSILAFMEDLKGCLITLVIAFKHLLGVLQNFKQLKDAKHAKCIAVFTRGKSMHLS